MPGSPCALDTTCPWTLECPRQVDELDELDELDARLKSAED
jgi:hypothetical protein